MGEKEEIINYIMDDIKSDLDEAMRSYARGTWLFDIAGEELMYLRRTHPDYETDDLGQEWIRALKREIRNVIEMF